jgi:hypothetical protein
MEGKLELFDANDKCSFQNYWVRCGVAGTWVSTMCCRTAALGRPKRTRGCGGWCPTAGSMTSYPGPRCPTTWTGQQLLAIRFLTAYNKNCTSHGWSTNSVKLGAERVLSANRVRSCWFLPIPTLRTTRNAPFPRRRAKNTSGTSYVIPFGEKIQIRKDKKKFKRKRKKDNNNRKIHMCINMHI